MNDIDYCAPLGKSNQASLVINCMWQSKYIYNNIKKGDYEAFRSYVNIDWLRI